MSKCALLPLILSFILFSAAAVAASDLAVSVPGPDIDYQGENDSVTVTINNTGNVSLAINLTATTDDKLNLTLNESQFSLGVNASKQILLNVITSSSTAIGSNSFKVSASGTNSTENRSVSAEQTISLGIEYPYCDLESSSSQIEINEIVNTDDIDGEEFKPGDKIDIEVKVENEDNEDHDVVVKAVLVYDSEEVDDSEVKEEINLDEDSKETVTLTLEIPTDVEAGDHYLYIKAYDDDDEDDCDQKELELEIEKESHEVIPYDVEVEPETVQCDYSYTFSGRVANIGRNDEEKVKVEYSDELGHTATELYSDLDEGDKSAMFSFTNYIPKNASEKSHKLTLKVSYDYDDDDERYEKSKTSYYYLTVEGNCFEEIRNASLSAVTSTAFVGSSSQVKLDIVNTGNVAGNYTISAEAAWATINSISPETFTLNSGTSQKAVVSLTPSADTEIGSHSLTVKLTYGGKTETKTISVNVQKESEIASFGEKVAFEIRRNIVWFIIDVVLLAAIVTLIIWLVNLRKKAALV